MSEKTELELMTEHRDKLAKEAQRIKVECDGRVHEAEARIKRLERDYAEALESEVRAKAKVDVLKDILRMFIEKDV